MKIELTCLAIVGIMFIGIAIAEMPFGFYMAMNDQKSNDALFIKNYEAGAAVTEAYTGMEHMERNTEIKTGSYDPSDPYPVSGRNKRGLDAMHLKIILILLIL